MCTKSAYVDVIRAYKVVRVNLAEPVDLSAACTLARLLGRTIGGRISRTTPSVENLCGSRPLFRHT